MPAHSRVLCYLLACLPSRGIIQLQDRLILLISVELHTTLAHVYLNKEGRDRCYVQINIVVTNQTEHAEVSKTRRKFVGRMVFESD